MSLMVDPSLNWIFYIIAGDAWPQGDEDALRELAAELDQVAQRIASAGQGFNQLSQHVTANVGGEVQTNFANFANNLSTMGSTFVARAQQQAASLREQALNIENAKYGMLISIAVTAAEVLWALADPFTAPLVPEIMAVGREVVNEVERTLIQRLTSLLSRIAREAAEEAAEEVAEDMLAQGIQIAQGNRNGFDWNSIKQSAILGGAGGTFAHGAAKGLGKFDNNFGTNFSKNVFGESGIEAATEVVVGGLGAVAFGGGLDSLGWSALNGGLSGAATHGAHRAGESLADKVNGGGDTGGKGGGLNDVGDTGFNKGNVGRRPWTVYNGHWWLYREFWPDSGRRGFSWPGLVGRRAFRHWRGLLRGQHRLAASEQQQLPDRHRREHPKHQRHHQHHEQRRDEQRWRDQRKFHHRHQQRRHERRRRR